MMNEEELKVLLEQHHAAGYGWALSCCRGNAVEAEDVLQTVYLKIVEGKARYDGASTFRTWLFAVIRRTAADEYRRRARWWLTAGELTRETQMQKPTLAQQLEETVEQAQRCTLFRNGLATLSARQQEVLRLVFYHDLTIEEAANIMGVSIGSARTHYERGKQALRLWMATQQESHEL